MRAQAYRLYCNGAHGPHNNTPDTDCMRLRSCNPFGFRFDAVRTRAVRDTLIAMRRIAPHWWQARRRVVFGHSPRLSDRMRPAALGVSRQTLRSARLSNFGRFCGHAFMHRLHFAVLIPRQTPLPRAIYQVV